MGKMLARVSENVSAEHQPFHIFQVWYLHSVTQKTTQNTTTEKNPTALSFPQVTCKPVLGVLGPFDDYWLWGSVDNRCCVCGSNETQQPGPARG